MRVGAASVDRHGDDVASVVQPRDALRHDRVARARGDELDGHGRVGLRGRERVVREVVERQRLRVGQGMVLGQHGHGDLLPEVDRVQAVRLDGQAHERDIRVAGEQVGELVGLLDAGGLEGQVGPAVRPGAQPLRGAHPGDIAEPQRHSAPVPCAAGPGLPTA